MTLITKKVDLVKIFRELGPEWNHLELQLELSEKVRSDSTMPYATLREEFGIGLSNFYYEENEGAIPSARSTVQVFNGSYPIGKPFFPVEVTIEANGHAYPTPLLWGPVAPERLWNIVYQYLRNEVEGLLEQRYKLKKISGFRNARGNWPPGSMKYDGVLSAEEFYISIDNIPH